ncbi:MAG: hypothetical protein J6Q53_05255 [Oscillospiraceae bacterium]|nr:hypothetical protein [Oscillospiraceae bacterium]
MYNRYIPQPDGSYRRNRMPDQSRHAPPRPTPSRQPPCPPEQEKDRPLPKQDDCRPAKEEKSQQTKQERRPCGRHDTAPTGGSVGSFLRQLLPKDFDTGDLLIILLLLLMAGDCAEDQNTAILTLALYLFM